MVEAMNMELEQEPQDHDTDLMSRTSEVAPLSPPPTESEPAPSEQGWVVLLDDDLVMDVYNLSFDESQQMIVQARIKHLLDDHASPKHIEERVIVSDVRRLLATLIDASKAYIEATSSIVKFLLAENDQMAKDLQEIRQRTE